MGGTMNMNRRTGRFVESFNNQTGDVNVALLTSIEFDPANPCNLLFKDQDGNTIATVPFDASNICNLPALDQDNKFRLISIDPNDLTTVDDAGVVEYLNQGLTISDKELIILQVEGVRKYFLRGLGKGTYGGVNPQVTTSNLLAFDDFTVIDAKDQSILQQAKDYADALAIPKDNEILYFNSGYDSGLSYNVQAEWTFDGNIYNVTQAITLSASDPTNDRIDVIAVDADGNIVVLTGTPAANPVKPEIDVASQMEGTFIIIPANATTPQGVTESFIYNENAQEAGGEWNTTENTAGQRIILNSTNNPYSGSVSVEGTNLNQYDYFRMTTTTPINASDIKQISYRINLKTGIYYKNSTLVVVYGTKGNGKRGTAYLQPSDHGFSHTTYNSWQFISMAMPSNSTLVTVDYIAFYNTEVSEQLLGYYVDNFRIINNTEEVPTSGGGVSQAYVDQKDAETLAAAKQYSDDNKLSKGGYIGTAQDLKDEIDNMLHIEVIDNLTSVDTDKALSANQGKVLKQFIDDINTLLNSDDTTLDELQEIVNYIKQNKSDLENLSIANIAGLQGALDGKEAGLGNPAADGYVLTSDAQGNRSWTPPTVIGETGGTGSVENRYNNITDMIAGQGGQTNKAFQYVADASTDSTVDSGWAYYEYLGTTVGDLTDYRKLSEQESIDTIGEDPNKVNIRLDNVAADLSTAEQDAFKSKLAIIDGGGGEAGAFQENRFVWSTGNPQTFTVTDSNRITDVYMNGKRLEKFLADGTTPDEWRINSGTEIEVLITLDDQDVITIVSSTVVHEVNIYGRTVLVNASRNIADSDNGKILVVSATVILTVPSTGISDDFSCDIDCLDTGQATLQDDAGGAVLDSPHGLRLEADKMGTVYRKPVGTYANEYRLRGEFKV
jgi:hypothetical protein